MRSVPGKQVFSSSVPSSATQSQARAIVATLTSSAPALSKALAAPLSVAPVVSTSSTSRMRFGIGTSGITPKRALDVRESLLAAQRTLVELPGDRQRCDRGDVELLCQCARKNPGMVESRRATASRDGGIATTESGHPCHGSQMPRSREHSSGAYRRSPASL